MRSYSTRPVKTSRYLLSLLILTLLYLLLILPAAAAIAATLMSLATAEDGFSLQLVPPFIALLASGTYPLVALLAIVVSWARYSQRRFPQAVAAALLPLVNLALFALAVVISSLLVD